MYKEVLRMQGINKTVKEVNENFKKVFGFDYFDTDDLELFDIDSNDLAMIHANGFIAEEDGETVFYEEVF